MSLSASLITSLTGKEDNLLRLITGIHRRDAHVVVTQQKETGSLRLFSNVWLAGMRRMQMLMMMKKGGLGGS